MRVETRLSPAPTLKSACVGKNRYFKKNVRVKGLNLKSIMPAFLITIMRITLGD